MIRIISDSSSDILPHDNLCHAIVPLTLYAGDKEFVDNEEMDIRYFMECTAKEKSHTACPSVGDWLKAFGDEDGDTIYAVTITSGLSGCYNAAMNAKAMYEESHPHSKVRIFDSLSVGPEMRMGVEKIIDLVREGKAFEEIDKIVQEYIDKARIFFIINSLDNLANNGRVPHVVASAFGFFGISVIGTASEKGEVQPIDKSRGEKKSLASIIKHMQAANYQGGRARVAHINNPGLAEKAVAKIKEVFGEIDILSYEARGIVSYYVSDGGLIVGCETC